MKKRQRAKPVARLPGNFEASLSQRAADFLARPIPTELRPNYIAGSVADQVIVACARNQRIDPELLELAELTENEYEDFIAEARTTDLKTYYAESRDLLMQIIAVSQ